MPGYLYHLDKEHPLNSWRFGGLTGIQKRILKLDGQWKDSFGIHEVQRKGSLDLWGCVSFSILDCIEAQHIALTGKEVNWSDVALAQMSGTKINYGNSGYAVSECIRKQGLVLEEKYDWPDSASDYHSQAPKSLLDEAKKWFDTYSFNYEWVRPRLESYQDDLIEALKESPLAVGVKYASGSGILNPTGSPEHFVVLAGYKYGEYWLINDSYTREWKKYAWNYRFSGLLKSYLTIKEPNMIKLEESQCYKLVEGGESKLAVAIDGKLMVFSKEDGYLAMPDAISRLGDITKLKVISVSLVDWNSTSRVDTKGNPIR